MIDLTSILQTVIALLAALITARLVPWIKSKTTAQQQATLAMVVDVLVYAAEQIYGSDTGQQKVQYVRSELEKRGYAVDIAQIEAAVRKMNQAARTKDREPETDDEDAEGDLETE